MSEATYQIVFRGKILTGFDRGQVRANLAQLFKTDPARIDALLDAPKTVLKTGLSKDAGARYQEVLRAAGIMVALISDAPTAPAPIPAPPVPASQPSSPSPQPQQVPTQQVQASTAAAPETNAENTASGLTLAAAGERLLPPSVVQAREIDTSALSLAAVGVTLVEAKPVAAPEFDLSALDLASDEGPIDPTPKPPPAAIDTSALQLDDPPPEEEKPMTALQKLLASSVGD